MAAEFASRFDSQLIVLHVAPLFSERIPAIRRSWLDKFGEMAFGELRVERVLLCSDNDVASEIVTYANRHEIDLILMPTHGYGPFRRFFLGSVTLKVLHDALSPVWTTAHKEEPTEYCGGIAFRNIVCAVDLSDKTGSVANRHFGAKCQ